MKESFIFYRSFFDAAAQAPDRGLQKEILWHLVEVCLDIKAVEDIPFPASAIAVQALASVESAKRRYDKSIEDGKKGGRPSVWIDQEEAERLYSELGSWGAVADKMNVHRDTLRRARYAWSHQTPKNAEKPKNPNVYVSVSDSVSVSDYVSVSESDYVSDSDTRNNNKKEPDSGAAGAHAPHPNRKEEQYWHSPLDD